MDLSEIAKLKAEMICRTYGKEYLFDDAATEFVPYAIEYLSDYVSRWRNE